MNSNLRKTLDWVELPYTLIYFLSIKKESRVKAEKALMEISGSHWRSKTIPFKICIWFLNILNNPKNHA